MIVRAIYLFLLLEAGKSRINDVSKYVYYLDWITDSVIEANHGNSVLLNDVTNTDDLPLQYLNIPFPFPFLGALNDFLFVNANGAIQFETINIPPCGPDFIIEPRCNLNTSYFGTVAAFLTDLNPSYSKKAKITFFNDSKSLTVQYENIPLILDSQHFNTFHVVLNADGHISIKYINLYESPFIPIVVGLRKYSSSRANYLLPSKIQSDNAGSWSTTLDGVYPLKPLIKSNMTYDLCPISALWCLSPAVIPLYSQLQAPIHISISTLSVSCTTYFKYSCAYFLTSSLLSPVAEESATYDSSNSSFTCQVPSAVRNVTGVAYVIIRGYFKDTSSSHNVNNKPSQLYIDITRSPLSLAVTNDGPGRPATLPPQLYYRGENSTCSALWTAKPESCSWCALCQAYSTGTLPPCLQNDSSCSTLYDQPDCGGHCVVRESSDAPTTTSTPTPPPPALYTSLVQDRYGGCCSPSNFDCNGVCGGQSTVRRVSPGTTKLTCQCNSTCYQSCGGPQTCPPTPVPTVAPKIVVKPGAGVLVNVTDTRGAGTSTIEVRGDRTGRISPLQVISARPLTPTPHYFIKISFHHIAFPFQQIENPESFVQYVQTYFNSSYLRNVDPLFNISEPNAAAALQPGASLNLTVSASVGRVLGGAPISWTLKHFIIYYSEKPLPSLATLLHPNRSAQVTGVHVLSVPLEVTFTPCTAVKNKFVCSNLPGCIFCVTYSGIRVLRADGGDVQLAESGPVGGDFPDNKWSTSDNPATGISRSLYNYIVPNGLGTVNEKVEGYCRVGADTEVCDVETEGTHDTNGNYWSAAVIMVGTVALAVYLYFI